MACLGELRDPLDSPALLAEDDGHLQWHGAGTALIEAVEQLAAQHGCARLWVITTNANIDALRFYQRRGFCLAAVHRGAVDDSRSRLKPEIPEVGAYGIPLRDEIELEKRP